MQRYREYRLLKKVKKVLNTEVKEETYAPPRNIYMGDKSLSTGDSILDPSRKLRMAQVETVARLLVQLIGRLDDSQADACGDRSADHQVEAVSAEIAIVFEELKGGVLFTEAEKITRRRRGAQGRIHGSIADDHATCDLATLKSQVQDWLQEHLRRKSKFKRVETGIRDLALNVNDVRCSQILRDRQAAVAALNSTTEQGMPLLQTIFDKIQNYANLGFATTNKRETRHDAGESALVQGVEFGKQIEDVVEPQFQKPVRLGLLSTQH